MCPRCISVGSCPNSSINNRGYEFVFSGWGFFPYKSFHTNLLKGEKSIFWLMYNLINYRQLPGGCRWGGGDPLGLSSSRPRGWRIRARQFQAAYGHLSVPILHFLQLLRTGETGDSAKQLSGSSNKIAKKAKIAIVVMIPCHIYTEFLCVYVSKLAWNSRRWPALWIKRFEVYKKTSKGKCNWSTLKRSLLLILTFMYLLGRHPNILICSRPWLTRNKNAFRFCYVQCPYLIKY